MDLDLAHLGLRGWGNLWPQLTHIRVLVANMLHAGQYIALVLSQSFIVLLILSWGEFWGEF